MSTTASPRRHVDTWAEIQELLGRTAAKVAEEPATSHPSAKVDNGAEPATSGAHAASIDSDLKDQSPPAGTQNVSLPTSPTADQKDVKKEVPVTGPEAAPPSGQPATGPNEPPTSSQMSGEDQEKYSSWTADTCINMGNSILADIAMQTTAAKTATATPANNPSAVKAAPDAKAAATAATQPNPTDAADAGAKAAAAVAEQMEAQQVNTMAHDLIKAGSELADLTADYIDQKMTELVKAGEDPMAMMGGDPAAAMPAGGEDPAALLAAFLEQTGMSPEELLMLLEQGLGGSGESAEPAPAPPAEPPSPEAEEPAPKEAAVKQAAADLLKSMLKSRTAPPAARPAAAK